MEGATSGGRAVFPRPLRPGIVVGVLVVLLGAPLASATVVGADLEVERVELEVRIEDTVAVSNLTVGIRNPSVAPREALLEVPLPETAVLTSFVLVTHNRTIQGVVQERDEAQQRFDVARAAGQDAVLLRSAGHGLLSLSLSVAGSSSVVLRASYVELVSMVRGEQSYGFPLASFGGAGSVGFVSVDVVARAGQGWASAEVEGLPGSVTQEDGRTVAYRFEGQHVDASGDFALRLVPESAGWGASVILSALEGPAAAVVTVAPPELGAVPIAKDVVFVLDRSGSMAGSKIEQARAALGATLGELRAGDRFGLVRFDDVVETYPGGLHAVSAGRVADAQGWVAEVEASGATDIAASLAAALRVLNEESEGGLAMVVLITDGLPTHGLQDLGAIIDSVRQANRREARVHAVGIGFDRDDAFLSELAGSTRGQYRALSGEGDVEEDLEGFFRDVSSAVLRDVSVRLEGVSFGAVHPDPVPDVYAGSHLVVTGRVNASGLPEVLTVTVSGVSASGPLSFSASVEASDWRVAAPAVKLWARHAASDLERVVLLEPGSPQAQAAQEELLALGVAYQVATLATSWVLADSLPPEEVPGGASARLGGAVPASAVHYDKGSPYASSTAPTLPASVPASAPGSSGGDARAGSSPAEEAGTPAVGVVLLVGCLVGLAAWRRRRG